MDSESLPLPKFEIHPHSWAIDRVVLFAEAEGAAVFLEHVFPLSANCLVVSADRHFPKDPELNRAAFSALESDSKIRLVVFNISALKAISVKTERILAMDELVMQDFKK